MVKVAIMGYGVVGSGVAQVLTDHYDSIAGRAKEEIDIKYILDLRDFPDSPFQGKLIKDFAVILNDPEVRVVAEVMGGLHPAYDYVKALLEAGKSVVTSNKELVAAKGAELLKIAQEKNVNFLFEANKFHKAEVALPGGCVIGARPIDQHLKGFRALGAEVIQDHGMLNAFSEQLKGNHIFFDVSSVGATINVMLAAVRAEGRTVIENAAKEPHVVDVANMLNSMGADIRGAGTDKIRITGVPKLHGTVYSTIPDQIEAGTFMCAAAATGGEVLVKNVIPRHLECITSKLIEMGCSVEEYDDAVKVKAGEFIRCANIKTLPYPGFPTDMQPQMAAVLSMANGVSTVTESIFENRFKYMSELGRMGAVNKVEGNTAIITGVGSLEGASVAAPDLRAGAALVIAGLAAEGFTTVTDIVYIKRGYEKFDQKLAGLGAIITEVDTDKEEQKFKLKVG